MKVVSKKKNDKENYFKAVNFFLQVESFGAVSDQQKSPCMKQTCYSKVALSKEPSSMVCVTAIMKDMDESMAGDGDGHNCCNSDKTSDETSNNDDANSNWSEGGDEDKLYVEDDDLMGGSDDNDGKERKKKEKDNNKKEEDEDEKNENKEEDNDDKEDDDNDEEGEDDDNGEKVLTKKDFTVPGRPDTLCKFKLFAFLF
jgi:TATA-binding protein-associated factor Taf7